MYKKKYFYFIIITLLHLKLILAVEYLNKYSFIEVDGTQIKFIIFDSSSFGKLSTMYFKFTSATRCDDDITFEFSDSIEMNNLNKYNNLNNNLGKAGTTYEVINGVNKTVNYYNIEKSPLYFNIGEGNNLIIGFRCDGMVKIENTQENLSNDISDLETGSIVGICFGVIVFILFIVLFFYSCYDCKRKCTREPISSTERPFQFENNIVPMSYNYYPNPIIYNGNIQQVPVINPYPYNKGIVPSTIDSTNIRHVGKISHAGKITHAGKIKKNTKKK